MESFPGYDAWKLAYPPHWDNEPEPPAKPCEICDDEGEFEDDGQMVPCHH